MRNLALIVLGLLLALPAAGADCRYSKSIDETFAARHLSSLQVNVLAGSLDVTGYEGEQIHFRGNVCVDQEKFLDRIFLEASDDDSRLDLTLIIPSEERDFLADYAYVDVEINVPASLDIALRDSSGNIRAEGARVTSIDDSSGDMRVIDNRGPLDINDSSGGIKVRGVDGDIGIQDSSGDISLRDIHGKVMIPRDSSGDIEIDTIAAAVTIDRDGSGSIDIDQTGGPVTIGSDGSGNIDIRRAGGDVVVDRDGSGNIRVTDVEGNFRVHADGSGSVHSRRVAGDVSVP